MYENRGLQPAILVRRQMSLLLGIISYLPSSQQTRELRGIPRAGNHHKLSIEMGLWVTRHLAEPLRGKMAKQKNLQQVIRCR